MANYEGVFIVNPDLSADQSKTAIGQIQDLITKNGGQVDGLQDWGKKRMAYKIKKKTDGTYFIVNFQLPSSATKKIEQTLRLNDDLLRFMIVNKDLL